MTDIQTRRGLRLLGWRADSRTTPDEYSRLERVAKEALELNRTRKLTFEARATLSDQAFHLLKFQTMNAQERAFMVSGPYTRSRYLRESIALIDEATLAYYRGYSGAALALLFIAVERFLLGLCGWSPPARKPSFAKLKGSIAKLPVRTHVLDAAAVLSRIYADYSQPGDARFEFNRHALLHGMRTPILIDQINCVRAFILLDTLTAAEGEGRSIIYSDEFHRRLAVYTAVVPSVAEIALIRPESHLGR